MAGGTNRAVTIEIGFVRFDGHNEPFTDLAKQFARRQSISSANGTTNLAVLDGELKINKTEEPDSDLDDEIPF